MSDSLDWRSGDNSKFLLEAAALAVFGGLVVLLIGPTFTANWLATGAVFGAVYWTVMYDERLDRLRSRFPGETATMLVGFFYVVVVSELLDGRALKSSLIVGFVAGFVVAGLVDGLQTHLAERIEG